MHTTLIRTVAVVLAVSAASAGARTVIQNKGSDTLVNVAQAWAENYQNVDADVAVAVSGGGSGTGIAAMINATVDIANASRQMKRKEIDLAKSRGQDPVEHVVGYDALAVFLHPDNPLDTVSIAQLAEAYGEEGETENWGQLGIEVPGCKGQEIILVSRQNNSGTYAYIRKAVLGAMRDYKLGTRDMHGSKDVVHLVEKTPCAIGYSGLAYATDHVKMACIATFAVYGEQKSPRVHNILFVDRDNGCASQMAEAIARKTHGGHARFRSAGQDPAAALDSRMVTFMERHGFDMSTMAPCVVADERHTWVGITSS